MKPSNAIEWIRETFKESLDKELVAGNELCQSIPEELFIEVLDAIERRLPPSSGPTGLSIRRFLYCGCVKFNRWFAPSPYVLSNDRRKHFDRFVKYLALSEPDTTNTAVFFVNQIRWDLYSLLDHKSRDEIQNRQKEIDDMENKLEGIIAPRVSFKLKEFEKQYAECKSIINSAKNNLLHTFLITRLPINPVNEPCTINTKWKNIKTRVSLSPHWIDPPNTFIKAEGLIAIPQTSSQWQHGYCDVMIDVEGLLDPAAGSVPLVAPPDQGIPFESWPTIFIDAFEILDSVIWKLRETEKIQGNWLLHPNDIATIEYELKANSNRVDWVVKGPPGLVIRYTNKKPETKEIDIDISQKTEWYIRCKILADTFLKTGEINEALFWLNVGIEALFEKRTRDICDSNGIDYELLASGKTYWERAKAIVEKQLPDAVDKIKWPEAAIGSPSWFTKIRYLSKHVSLKHNATEILEKYHIINRHRNALFHGLEEKSISIDIALEALDAFGWLEKEFF